MTAQHKFQTARFAEILLEEWVKRQAGPATTRWGLGAGTLVRSWSQRYASAPNDATGVVALSATVHAAQTT